jgi:UDP-N-acetyl-2-amino-2-deoxyglucuronate dehydrogenase
MKRFGVTGVCGFVAPRHLQAIKETGNEVAACLDVCDSAGILDRYFPGAEFFTEEKKFYAHIRDAGYHNHLHYLSVCTPNHLHYRQVEKGLDCGLDVICEKPLVLSSGEVHALAKQEQSSGKRIFNLLQLRLHPNIALLKEKVAAGAQNQKWDVDLTYVTPRGKWYHNSWKGDEHKSGGIATNIGIHFFDMLIWIFGAVQNHQVHLYTPEKASGYLELQNARVRWFLSIDAADLPQYSKAEYSHRSIVVNNSSINFTTGFEGLHTKAYQAILNGEGFGITETLPSIALTEDIRSQNIHRSMGDVHPLLINQNL